VSEKAGKAQGRAWLWLIPLGCFGALVVAGCIVFAVLWLVFGLLKSSEPYKRAMEMAQGDPRVAAALGEPVEASRVLVGNIEETGETGHAELSIPLCGPKGRGTLSVVANKSRGRWIIEEAVLTVTESDETIDLLKPGGRSDER